MRMEGKFNPLVLFNRPLAARQCCQVTENYTSHIGCMLRMRVLEGYIDPHYVTRSRVYREEWPLIPPPR